MAAEQAFFWGRGGRKLTQDQIDQEKKVAEALMKQGMDYSPVGHWSQGLARVAQGVMGAIDDRMAGAEQKDLTDYNASLLADAIKSYSGASAATASSSPAAAPTRASIPMSGAASEVSGTSPRVATAGVSALPDATELNAYLADESRRATLPAGMRNNNPGNIKFVGQKVPGIVGPSVNTDQGDPQAVFDTPESGMRAMHSLLLKKYNGGKLTPNQIIAGNMGWTPGNFQAAANVARYAGIGPDDDIGLNDPTKAAKFMRGLMMQEHGKSSNLYPDSMILSALTNGAPTQVASLDPSAGMPPAAAAIEKAAPQSGYIDPMVSVQPNAAVPALDAPQTVSPAPAVASVPTQEVAQNGQYPAPPAPPSPPAPPQAPAQSPIMNEALVRAITDPRASPGTRGIAQIIIQQQMQQQQAQRELQMKQNDPAYRLGLEKSQLEIENMRNPRLTPGDQLAREKFDWEKQNSFKTNDIKEYEYAKERGYTGSITDFMLANKKAGATSVTVGGGDNKQVFDAVAESASGAKSAAVGLNALREARNAVEGGIISGAGANARLGLQRVGALLGVADPNVIVNTETFRSAIAPQVAATMKATVGSTQISNADREFAEKAAGGSIELNDQTIRRLLGIMERAGTAAISSHMDRLNQVYPPGAGFDRERALFSVTMPDMASQPPAPPSPPSPPSAPTAPEQVPEGVDPGLWQHMTPEERSLWK
jgi:hypothetical protein